MRAGPLRHRVDLEEPVDVEDDMGGVTTGWSRVATVWGSIEPLTGREFMAGQQILAEADVRVRVRWSPQLEACTPAWRVLHGDTILNSARVIHVRLGRQMVELLCKTGTNEG